MDPEQIAEISIATSGLHPELDVKSLTPAAMKIYADRWDRCSSYLNAMMEDDLPPNDDPAPAAETMAERQPVRESGSVAVMSSPDADFEAQVLADLASLPVAEPDRPNRGGTRTLSEGAQLVVNLVVEPMMMARILGEVSAAGKDVSRQTVYEWTVEAVQAEQLEKTTKKGQYQPIGWTAPEGSDQD
jgi:hypothetical protein